MSTAPTSHDARPEHRRHLLVLVLAATMAGLACLIVAPGLMTDPGSAVPGPQWVALVPLFAVTEVVVIHLPTQRNAHGHTLREIPAVLGLTFLAPQQYVTAYVVGCVAGLVLAAHMRGVKLAFNAAMFALEAAVGALVYHSVLVGGDPLSPTGWAAVLAAVLVTDLLSAAAVTAAISLTEGVFDGEVLREALRSGSLAAFINTCVALLVATLVLVRPSALPLLGVVVVLLVLAYRVYVSLARGHARTQVLYRFVARTASTRSLDDVVDVVLREAADLMQAEHACLVEVLDGQTVRIHTVTDGTVRVEHQARPEPTEWWWAALDQGVVQYEAPSGARSDTPSASSPGLRAIAAPRDGLAASLPDGGHAASVLVVVDRSFDKETFGEEDVQIFQALAAHAGVAAERARTVTDLQVVAEELEEARDEAVAASEAKSMFLANMSHEIRTPLTTTLASAEMLEDTTLDPLQTQLLDRVRRSGHLLLSLVENLLDFSRVDAGEAELESAPFDLREAVSGIADSHVPEAQRRGLDFECVVDAGVPHIVVGDRTRVLQILNNLVSNAMKFTPSGCIRLETQMVETDGHVRVQFAVHDTGIGIGVEQQPAIFEAFKQVDGSTTRGYGGTGLGLAICRQLAELMGGSITVTSQEQVGSTFRVELPLVPGDEPTVGDVAAPIPA